MAYDRYDSRGSDRGGWRDQDRYSRDHRDSREGDDRGFFERARDEVTSWFGDESSGGRRMEDDRNYGRDNMNWSRGGSREAERGRFERDEQRRYGSQDRGMFGSGSEPWGRGSDDDRYGGSQRGSGMFGREQNRDRARFMGGGEDRDFGQGGFGYGGRETGDRGRYPGTLGQSAHSDRDQRFGSFGRHGQEHDDYRPMTGDYGRGSGGFRPEQGRGSGMGGQDFARSQYGRQDFSQDQERDRDMGRPYSYGGWGDRDSQRQSFRSGSGSDDHYTQWRERQIQELDRDYDEYRREHQSKFENEFSGWRQQRQTKRQMLQSIREHMEVVDEDGEHIGTVDKVHGDHVVLTRNDPSAGGVHRSFGCTLLERVDDKIHLSGKASSIRGQLREHRDDHRDDDRGGGGFFSGLFGGGSSDERQGKDQRDERPASTSTNRPDGEGPHMLDRSFSGTYDDQKDDKK